MRNLTNSWLDEGEIAVQQGNFLKQSKKHADAAQACSVHFDAMEMATVNRKRQDIKLPPQADPDQAYHWTPEWEAGEREVDAELASGRFQVYASIDDMFDDMDRAAS